MVQIEPQPNADTTQRRPVGSEPKIRLVFDKFQAFVDEYRPKISLGGVFLESSQPHPVGTRVSCEFQLADGFRLCRAVGEVTWLRPTARGPGLPAGMGVRFVALDDQGRELILKILEEQVKSGGEPFEVERVPDDAVTGPPPSPRGDPASTHPRRSPLPGPQEDPASTYSRPSVVVAAGPPPEAAAAEEFKAPWGQELPEFPDDVIEPAVGEDVLATAYEDFDSDLSEAGFASDTDLLDEVADELSFSDEALDDVPPVPSFDVPSFDAPSFGSGAVTGLEAEAFAPGESDFDDMDLPLPDVEPVEAALDAAELDAADPDAGELDATFGDPSELMKILGSAGSARPEPAEAAVEEPVSQFGMPEPLSSTVSSWAGTQAGRAWEGDHEDGGWEQDQDSTLRSGFHRVQLTVAESSGRFAVILGLLVVVVAALIFKEQVLAWVGLGSPPAREVSGAPLADPAEEPLPVAEGGADLDAAASEDRPEVIEVGSETTDGSETTAATAFPSPLPPLRPARAEPGPGDERPASDGPAAVRARATRVERVTFDQAADGTWVTIWLDGSLAAGQYEHNELSYDPRKEQLVVSGIGTPFASTIDVGTLELDRIRTGLHAGNRLNLVFDLSSEHMTLAEIRSRDNRLEILVRRR